MSEENNQELLDKIADLEQQLEDAKNDNSFNELKSKYEKIIEDRTQSDSRGNKTKSGHYRQQPKR